MIRQLLTESVVLAVMGGAGSAVLELLQADMPEADYTRYNEVDQWSAKLGVGKPRFDPAEMQRGQPPADRARRGV